MPTSPTRMCCALCLNVPRHSRNSSASSMMTLRCAREGALKPKSGEGGCGQNPIGLRAQGCRPPPPPRRMTMLPLYRSGAWRPFASHPQVGVLQACLSHLLACIIEGRLHCLVWLRGTQVCRRAFGARLAAACATGYASACSRLVGVLGRVCIRAPPAQLDVVRAGQGLSLRPSREPRLLLDGRVPPQRTRGHKWPLSYCFGMSGAYTGLSVSCPSAFSMASMPTAAARRLALRCWGSRALGSDARNGYCGRPARWAQSLAHASPPPTLVERLHFPKGVGAPRQTMCPCCLVRVPGILSLS